MAIRRPLVLVGGLTQELPVGDVVPPSGMVAVIAETADTATLQLSDSATLVEGDRTVAVTFGEGVVYDAREKQRQFDVTEFGAKLDGSDDLVALRAAYAAAVDAGGGTLFFAGIATVSAALDIDSSVGVTLLGDNRKTCGVKGVDQTVGNLLNITGSNVTLDKFQVDGSYESGASSGTAGLVQITDASNVRLHDCWIRGSLRNGVRVSGNSSDIFIRFSRFEGNYCGVRSFADVTANTVPSRISITQNEFLTGWDQSGNDQTGGVKLEVGPGVTAVSSGNDVSDNLVDSAGLLGIELWGGGGVFSDSVVSRNRILGTTSGNQFGISFNDCQRCIAAENIVRLFHGYVGIEMANACISSTVIGNTCTMYAEDGTTHQSSGAGIGVFNNVGPAPAYCSVVENMVIGARTGIQVQIAPHTKVSGNTVRDCSDVMVFIQGASFVGVTHNTFEGPCASFLFIDGSFINLTDIDFSYNTLRGTASFNGFWAYNNNTSYTLTNFSARGNNVLNASHENVSYQLLYDSAELINAQITGNFYAAGAGKIVLPDYYSADVIQPAFGASVQGFSIPVAIRYTFPVPSSAGDQWFKLFSYIYGAPITLMFHIDTGTTFLALDNKASSQTFFLAGSPYGQDCAVGKFPDAGYAGGIVKGVIYDNPSAGATHEVWLHVGPSSGGTITVAGGDFPASWIISPTAVTTAPSYNTNHYELDTTGYNGAFRSKAVMADSLLGSTLTLTGAANVGSLTTTGPVSALSVTTTGNMTGEWMIARDRAVAPLVVATVQAVAPKFVTTGGTEVTDGVLTANPSSGTAAKWKLGSIKTSTGLVVSAVKGIEVDIGGTKLTLAVLTTNP